MAGRLAASQTEKETRELKLAHSPDSDDAFMFYALATHKLATPGYKYTHVLSDIQSLNEAALTETYDVTAVSFAAYPSLRDNYVLLDCGASFGEGYGPIVVSTRSMKPAELKGMRIGVPGLKTSAYLTLKLYQPDFEAVVIPFDKIIDAVKNNVVEAGLLIHEGQLFFPQMGLHKVLDMGIWWQEQTGLPLPLGGNAVRKALGPELGRTIAKTIRDSVAYGLEHREEALNYAMQFAREMDTELADKFVGMYVNKWTLGYGERGKKAVSEFDLKEYMLREFAAAGIVTDEGPDVAVGANASDPHYGPTAEKSAAIREGDFLLLDVWGKMKEPGSVYYDITWVGYLGERVPDSYAKIFRIVKNARNAGIEFVKDAVAKKRAVHGWEVDRVTRETIRKAGYGKYFVHRTGHSIGQEVHGNGANMDGLETRDDRKIAPHTCFSIEPGIYLPEFGVRSEVNVYVGQNEARVTGAIQEEILPLLA